MPALVMISIHCATMTDSALALQAFLKDHGVPAWVCVQMGGGSDYREAITDAVKGCKVFLPLINNEWALSGECEDEYSLAKRLNLTSHEQGRTDRGQPREPILLPVAFPNLNWTAHKHVELLAAKTNFIVHDAPSLLEGNRERTFTTLLVSLAGVGVEILDPPLQVASRIEAFKISTTDGHRDTPEDSLAAVHSTLESLLARVQDLSLTINKRSIAAADSAEQAPVLGKEYLGVILGKAPWMDGLCIQMWADSVNIEFESYSVIEQEDEVDLVASISIKELRKRVDGKDTVEDDHPCAEWMAARNSEVVPAIGTWNRETSLVTLEVTVENVMRRLYLNVLPHQISGIIEYETPEVIKTGLTLRQIR